MSSKKILTVDIGNTMIKWGIWLNHELTQTGGCEHNSIFTEQLFAGCLPVDSFIKTVYVSSVAAKIAETALKEWAGDIGVAETIFMRVEKQCCGVTNAYSDPSSHGVDRWAALIGARSLYQTAVCVIDIGTAVTVDFMDGAGVHQGGVIMPGLDMMRSALTKNTAGIPMLFQVQDDSLGLMVNTTTAAVNSGTINLLRAGLQDVCRQAVAQFGETITIIITGGMSEKLMPQLISQHVVHDPHLILKGLHFAAMD